MQSFLSYYLSDDLSNDISGTTYGNIGRCLLISGNDQAALFLISKAYKTLKSAGVSFFGNHNIGYAAKWIYEVLVVQKKPTDALYFLLYAINLWENDIPEEANHLKRELSKAPDNSITQSIVSLESWQISKYCDEWVNSCFNEYIKADVNKM